MDRMARSRNRLLTLQFRAAVFVVVEERKGREMRAEGGGGRNMGAGVVGEVSSGPGC